MTIRIKKNNGKDILLKTKKGKSLLNIIADAGIPIRSDCGGKGICGKCTIKIPSEYQNHVSEISPAEQQRLSVFDINMGKRLACQTTMLDREEICISQINIVEDNGRQISSKINIGHSFDINSPIKRIIIDKTLLIQKKSEIFHDLTSLITNCVNQEYLEFSTDALKNLSCFSDNENNLTLIKNNNKIYSVLEGSHPLSLGLAVDLGTTTLAAYLCDLTKGNIVSASAKTNPQRVFGEDVISRIDFAGKKASNLKKMQSLIITAVNELINESAKIANVPVNAIDDACFAGNPTMQSIFLGLCPKSLGKAPYRPATINAIDIKNRNIGLIFDKNVNLHILPMASAFIGGDAMAAAIAIDPPGPQESILIIDLGTNGELLLLTDHGSFATSAATGPAFEGYTISCGVRAVPGAVNEINWNGKQNCFDFKVISGNKKNKIIGLCGSGLIDAVAALLKAGLMSREGRIKENGFGISEDADGRSITLITADKCNSDKALKLTQKDIRQLQLGKAALRVGIDYLLETADCKQITRTILTGAFGANFNWKNSMEIGMLPQAIKTGKISVVNNAAGLGAAKALLNYELRARAQNLSKSLHCINLGKQPGFRDRFAEASGFYSN